MRIKIISGTYGWRPNEDGSVEPVSKGNTCDVSDTEAARLIALGVAAYADAPTEAPSAPPVPPSGGGEPEGAPQDTTGTEPPAEATTGGEEGGPDASEVKRLERMGKDDLVQMALDMGIDISGARNNHERAVLIAAADDPEDGEVPPDLRAGDIVQ